MNAIPHFRYLQLENGWPSFQLSGLSVASDGTLTLAPLPTVATPITPPLPPAPGLSGPAGVGVDCDGTLYVADPVGQRILRVDPCDGSVAPLPCLSGPGSAPGKLNGPHGVHVGQRDTLYIADTGNFRIQVVELITGQVRAIWGQPDAWGSDPSSSTDVGRFQQPWDVTADRSGGVYVSDPGVQDSAGKWSGGRVQKFDAAGTVSSAFSSTIAAQSVVPGAPASVAMGLLDPSDAASEERLLVLDLQPPRLLVYALDGSYDAASTARWNAVNAMLSVPVSMVFGGAVLYVADSGSGQVLAFGADGAFIGVVRRATAPVAGIALDCHGRLVVHPGGGGAVQGAGAGAAYATCGSFLAGPFEGDATPSRWQRLCASVDPLPVGAHIQIYCLASDTMDGSAGHVPAAPATCSGAPSTAIIAADTIDRAPLDAWRAAPRDAGDLLALVSPSRYLWIAGVLQGDSTCTAAIHQMRLEYDAPSWLRYLPAIYRNNPIAELFLERALALFKSFLEDEYGEIRSLTELFDAGAAPDTGAQPTWLDWLASWFATDLDERWSEATRRDTVADAFRRDAWRGTHASLRRLVGLYAGVTPWIEEPGVEASVWALGAVSSLGFDTMLYAESAEGAVLGSTAVVDRSALIDASQYGAPLFADIANRFTAQVYAAQLPPGGAAAALALVRTILDREKPAHTTYDLCVIEPSMRVGWQARVGIDTIVGGPPSAAPFDGTLELGEATVLSGESKRRSQMSITGQDARVGVRSTLV